MFNANIDFVVGRIGSDVKLDASGNYANVNVAASDRILVDGKWIESTTWHHILVSGKQAAYAAKHGLKGCMVIAVGTTQSNKYKDREGNEREGTTLTPLAFKIIHKKKDAIIDEVSTI